MNDNAGKLYEVSFISKSENGASLMIGHLTRFGAEILSEGELKKLKLAYPIKKETSGYFGCVNCRLSTDAITQVNEAVKLDKEILRVLIVEPEPTRERGVRASLGSVPREVDKATRRRTPKRDSADGEALSNEVLEEKLEEILQ